MVPLLEVLAIAGVLGTGTLAMAGGGALPAACCSGGGELAVLLPAVLLVGSCKIVRAACAAGIRHASSTAAMMFADHAAVSPREVFGLRMATRARVCEMGQASKLAS
jgi:hypothetical protein